MPSFQAAFLDELSVIKLIYLENLFFTATKNKKGPLRRVGPKKSIQINY